MRFDPQKRRYVNEQGRVMSPAQVRREVNEYIATEKEKTEAKAKRLLNGTTSLTSFFMYLKSRVEAWHDVAGSIAYGGKAQLDPERTARVKEKVKSELAYLREFQKQARRSFEAARKIASQVSRQLEAEPIKSLTGKLTVTIRAELERKIFRELLEANPSEAERVTRKAVNDVLEGLEARLVADSLLIDKSVAEDLIGATIPSRAAMYADAAYSTFQNNEAAREFDAGVTLGRRICPEDDQSCFPAETRVLTTSGWTNIEEIAVGDSVITRAGPRRVMRLFSRPFLADRMVSIRRGQHEITTTPNHPFLTTRGWQRADSLSGESVVVLKDSCHRLLRHIPLPDAHDGKATRPQVGISGRVTLLLVNLPFIKRFKSRMSVPPIAIGLKDQVADPNIYNKFGLNDNRVLERDTEIGQYPPQFSFEPAGLVSLKFSLSLSQFRHYLRTISRALTQPRRSARTLRGIIQCHLFRVELSDSNRTSARQLPQFKSGSLSLDQRKTFVKAFSAPLSSMSRVVLNQKHNLLVSPLRGFLPSLLPTQSLGAGPAMGSLIASSFAAQGTKIDSLPRRGRISTPAANGHGALPTMPAFGAGNLLRAWNNLCPWATFETVISPSQLNIAADNTRAGNGRTRGSHGEIITVYNIEVAEIHEYIANGFVVHNCEECVDAADTYFTPLEDLPEIGSLQCLNNCRCYFETAEPDALRLDAGLDRLSAEMVQ